MIQGSIVLNTYHFFGAARSSVVDKTICEKWGFFTEGSGCRAFLTWANGRVLESRKDRNQASFSGYDMLGGGRVQSATFLLYPNVDLLCLFSCLKNTEVGWEQESLGR